MLLSDWISWLAIILSLILPTKCHTRRLIGNAITTWKREPLSVLVTTLCKSAICALETNTIALIICTSLEHLRIPDLVYLWSCCQRNWRLNVLPMTCNPVRGSCYVYKYQISINKVSSVEVSSAQSHKMGKISGSPTWSSSDLLSFCLASLLSASFSNQHNAS